MNDMEKLADVFDEIGICYSIEGNKIILDDFEVDGSNNEVTISFYEDFKYQEFKVYPR